MTENEIGKIIVDTAIKIHKTLGPGLFERVYEAILVYELEKLGLEAKRQVVIPIEYDNIVFDEGFRADVFIEDKVIVENKSEASIEKTKKIYTKQILTYLRLSKKKLGFVLNFGGPLMKDGIIRLVNGKLD